METGGTGVRIGFCCVMAGAGAALSVAACTDGPGIGQIDAGRLPLVFCERLLECGCVSGVGDAEDPLPPSCEAWDLGSIFPNPNDIYGGGGDYGGSDYGQNEPTPTISFDTECADRIADLIANAPCGQPLPELPCESYCSLYFGPGLEGQGCEASLDCGRNLRCVRGECRNACDDRPASGGEACRNQDECGVGLFCSPVDPSADEGVCVSLPSSGQPCLAGQLCAPGHWCDTNSGEPVCVASTPTGAECTGHSECDSGYCPAGFCELRPGPGEACGPQGQCRGDAPCIEDADGGGTCAADAVICESLAAVPYAAFEYRPYYY